MNETARDYAETKRGLKNQIQERDGLENPAPQQTRAENVVAKEAIRPCATSGECAMARDSGFQDRLATGALLAFGAPYDAEELACRETESQ